MNSTKKPTTPISTALPKYIRPWVFTRDVTTTPNCVLRCKAISLNAKHVWGVMARCTGGENVTWVGGQRIAEELACSRKIVVSAIAELVKAGFLERKRRGFGRTNVYHFLNHECFHDFFTDD